jgi:hypothetical protein
MIVQLDRKYYSYNFACWLRRNMRMEILSGLRRYSTYYMDKYLEKQYLNKNINVKNIVLKCSNSLYIDVFKDYLTISISGFEKYEDIPLAALANMITFGALGVRGIPILSSVFNRVSNNVFEYYKRYNPIFIAREISDVDKIV